MKRKKWTMSFMIVAVFVLGGRSAVGNGIADCALIAQDNSSVSIDEDPGVFVSVKTLAFHLHNVSNVVVDFDLGHSHGCCHHDALEFRLELDGVEIFSASFPFVNGNPSGCANTTFDTAALGDVAAGDHTLEVFLGDEGQNCFLEVFACPPSVCELGTVCDEHICKTVTYRTADGDCLVEAGEKVDFETTIEVINNTDVSWDKVVIGDCFFSDIVVTNVHTQQGSTQQFQAGNHKTCIRWKPGDLDPGDSATLVIDAKTGEDRRGRQEYVRCSNHPFNNGALLRFVDPHNRSFRTGPLVVSVLTPDAAGDCDGDGFSDHDELHAGTDPHDPTDFPCPQFDRIIDADGTATAGDGIPGAVNVVCGDVLASFPVTGATTAGLDWFDNDSDGQWTFGPGGDDLHSEDPGTCPTAIRDGLHQLGLDCKILDLDGSLFNGQQVDCDLEVNFPFTEPHISNGGCLSAINNIRYHDADGDGSWDDGEDIVLDSNGNGIFD